MMIVAYRLPKPGSANAPWVKPHLKKGVTIGVDGVPSRCWYEADSHRTHPDTTEKRLKDNSRVSIGKHGLEEWLGTTDKAILDAYQGFDLTDIPTWAEMEKCSVFLYIYDREDKRYLLSRELSYIKTYFEGEPNRTLYVTNDDNTEAHYIHVSDSDKLIGGKVCPHCGNQWFEQDDKNRNFAKKYKNHVDKCKINGGKIVKKIKLDK
jgi:hypothetical protein